MQVPTVWDETRVLDARVSDFVAVARRSGDIWYVGAMTDWDARDLTLDTAFLGDGTWAADVFRDGRNANRNPQDYQMEAFELEAGEPLELHLAPGGGWVARLRRTDVRTDR